MPQACCQIRHLAATSSNRGKADRIPSRCCEPYGRRELLTGAAGVGEVEALLVKGKSERCVGAGDGHCGQLRKHASTILVRVTTSASLSSTRCTIVPAVIRRPPTRWRSRHARRCQSGRSFGVPGGHSGARFGVHRYLRVGRLPCRRGGQPANDSSRRDAPVPRQGGEEMPPVSTALLR
jgi:hypothetical protein